MVSSTSNRRISKSKVPRFFYIYTNGAFGANFPQKHTRMKKLFVLLVVFILALEGYTAPSNKYQLVVKTTDTLLFIPLHYSPTVTFTESTMLVTNKSFNIEHYIPKKKLVEFSIEEITYHIVTWLNYDGTELWSAEWVYGDIPEYMGAENPVRQDDDMYEYVFVGWKPEIAPVVCDTYYTAQYDSIPKITNSVDNIMYGNIQYHWIDKNTLEFVSHEKIYEVRLLTIVGEPLTNKVNINDNMLNLEELHLGLYLLRINNKFTIKIIK